MKKLAVVALGGNALLRGDEVGTIQQQTNNTHETCVKLVELIKSGHNLVITHGNGPQVGNILLRNEAGYNTFKIPKMPLDICVADSQGGIGYMIEKTLRNIFIKEKIKKDIVTIVTEVLVDKNDHAFVEPTKPVGTYYLKEEAELLSKANGWVFKEDPRKRGWRRVVASPKPMDIMNKKVIKSLANKGTVVIAVGGGGVPVVREDDKSISGIDAVIDKDLASALLAKEIGADDFVILTDVANVFINFNKPDQKALFDLSVEEAEKHLADGQFTAGSMKPKIEAALNFVKNGGKEAYITEANQLADLSKGTRITL